MSLEGTIDRLRHVIGLDPDSIGIRALATCIQRRITEVGADDEAAYLTLLDADPEEMGRLIDATVVTETWFFRNRPGFDALQTWIARRAGVDATFRVLSLPCATGEEPYSLAIALLEAGIPAARLQIDAIDVSAHALARARRARYGPNSFRFGTDPAASPWFESHGKTWSPVPAVRERVRFLQGNVLDPTFMAGLATYDIVACRNLYIYLEPEPLDLAKRHIDARLGRDSVLMLGHADWTPALLEQFETEGPPSGFVYRPRRGAPPVQTPPAATPARRRPHRTTVAARPPSSPPRPRVAPPAIERLETLATARQLANRGLLDEAEAMCRQLLATGGPNADTLFLLALTSIARGEPKRAIEPLRRALALEPGHEEARIHLDLVAPRGQAGRRAS